MTERGARASRIAGVIFAVKGLLIYARDYLGLPVLDLKSVKAPREPRRDVVYLTEEEIDLYIPIQTCRAEDQKRTEGTEQKVQRAPLKGYWKLNV